MIGITFHHFHGGEHERSQGSLSADDLCTLLDSCRPIISPADVRNGVEGTCLTFDDGLRCQLDIALPILEERQISAFWFVSTDRMNPQELYRWWRCHVGVSEFYDQFFSRVPQPLLDEADDTYVSEHAFYSREDRIFRWLRDRGLAGWQYHEIMRAMIPQQHYRRISEFWLEPKDLVRLTEAGQTIGLHSHTHPMSLASLNLARQRWEYEVNQSVIFNATKVQPWSVAHPCGSYTSETLDLLRGMGVVLGFGANGNNGSRLAMPRVDCNLIEGALV